MNYCLAFDIGKNKSMVTLANKNGEVLIYPYEVEHSLESLDNLKNKINKFTNEYSVIMESTSIYHKIIVKYFSKHSKEVIVTNPLLASLTKKTLRKTKTDKIDCLRLTTIYFNKEYSMQNNDDLIFELRSQSRLIDSLALDISKIKNELLLKINLCFPQLETILPKESIYRPCFLYFISKYPHPSYLTNNKIKSIVNNLIKKYPHHKFYYNKMIEKLINNTTILPAVEKESLECHTLSYYAKSLLRLMEDKEEETKIFINNCKRFWIYNVFSSFDGVGELLAAYFTSELGDITKFETEKKLIAYCGLDPTIIESSKSVNYRGPISKRGNKYCRKHLFQAIMMILRNDGLKENKSDITIYYKKKRTEGKHHYEAVIACETKLLRKFYFRAKDYKEEIDE